ncbi:ATP-binding protein [Roseinatronobacter bogoriensis]|uniref:histidine kinase n=1 Tax=Roseinatronobacter bogoriensis subsp. barguzinensis TaxID=441209 RepID=A0A2K8KA80_9RHOB|nr:MULTISPECIES: ATP-binding protein [Rhodobaca]ATX65876.1 hypothetical protein BG454_08580 [Rhodobaca barguzinensis]MBB4208154.1 hypothetical protein [Rhodobaca bogoriensis DSM 18756]TDW38795.1 hypothetical protein LY39_01821 [Rhodobaca barguzinensis]TDY69167.1 multi-sensor hybrid histidine kinase [Rhodobaca bogoriensis DSM 18756]
MIQNLKRIKEVLWHKANIPALLALVVVVAGWAVAETQARNNYIQAQRATIAAQVAVLRADLEATVNGPIQLVRGLIAAIETEPDMDQTRFAELATRLIEGQQLLRNLAAAPDMVIRYMYPIEGNEQAIGLDYNTVPEQRDAALRARDLGDLVVAGPVDLVQGGRGFIGRFPVYVPNSSGGRDFWGLVSAVMDVEVLYAQAGLDDLLPFSVTLTGKDATGVDGATFFGPLLAPQDAPVISNVQLPTGSWQIAALPLGGWQTQHPDIWGLRALLTLAAGLILVPSIAMGRSMQARQRAISDVEDAYSVLQRQMHDLEAVRAAQAVTEQRLRDSLDQQREITNRFQDVADISRSWVWEQDAKMRFTYISESFIRITKVPADAILGRTRKELYTDRPETKQSADWQELERRVALREAFVGFLYRVVTPDGSDLWFQISGTPIFDADGRFCGYRGAGMDVTAMQNARAQAERANRAKTLFLANMSHEIRTPLNGVLGMAETLRDELAEPSHRRMAEMILSSGEGLSQVLNDILDIAKIESGKIQLDDVDFDPEKLVTEVVALHRPCCAEKNLKLNLEVLSSGAPRLRGDPHRVGQIIHNLLGNAVKFTDLGEITVTLRIASTGQMEIVVCDTGIGMSAEQQSLVFEDFSQADGSISRRFGGTGLGLSIVRRLVSLMHGKIEVSSELGVGTQVLVSLPLPLSQDASPTKLTATTDLTGLKVLIADDMPTNQLVAKALLKDTGAIITSVENGAQAVDAWIANQFDVMLLDISMPVMDGPSALSEIKRLAKTRELPPPPALAFTANVMLHQVAEYRAVGFAGCIAKPLRKAELVAQIAAAAGRI